MPKCSKYGCTSDHPSFFCQVTKAHASEARANGKSKSKVTRVYNVKIDRLPADQLEFKPMLTRTPTRSLPTVVDLRSKMPPVYDQGNLGSCTANALVAAFAYDAPGFMGSRLFLYYNERKLINSIPDDTGAYLSDGVICLKTYGLCRESQWPYVPAKFAVKPPPKCYSDALRSRATVAQNIMNDMNSMKNCLSSGFPFVVGILVYSSFESSTVARTGMVSMPQPTDALLGGHAVLVCGYTDAKQCWIVRNSWGASWGDKGYFYLPYAYLLDSSLSSDLWNITSFTNRSID